jgi:alpha-glucoside transport system substrate-binding protein
MSKRLIPIAAAFALLVAAALVAASTSRAQSSDVSGQLTVSGSWTGQDEAGFKAVLAGFMKQNPGVTVTYASAKGDEATALQTAAAADRPDLAVLSLPSDQQAMAAMEKSGVLQPLGFAASAVNADYAYSWKLLGSVDGTLTGLFVKATDRSAFWYDTKAWAALGISPPSSWSQFAADVATIKAHGLNPLAVSGSSAVALPNLFQNLYLSLQGNHRYDQLAAGTLKWSDPSVASTLTLFKRDFGTGIAGGLASLKSSYADAVLAVFGSPMKAYMVPGGSSVFPVLAASVADRPLSHFGTFAFPRTSAKAPARVIGDADAVVMVKDSPAARALVDYLATPAAAAIWAGRGTDFLSPNRKVPTSAYSVPALGQLAEQLASANVFRFGIADMAGTRLTNTMSLQLARYLEGTDTRGDVMSRLALAAGGKS